MTNVATDRPGGLTLALAQTLAVLERVEAGPNATISPARRHAENALAEAPRTAAHTVDRRRRLPRVSLAADEESEGQLQIVALLGEGGMGRVDLAVQRSFERIVAVKRVRPDRRCVPAVEALLREAEIVGSLEHPNVVPAHEFGQTDDGEPILVMKRVEGVSWHSLLRAGDAVKTPAATRRHLEILIDVCNAVEFAHRRGIVHCDLKPENVMVGDLGEVFVLDWGVAVRLARERSTDIAGTPAYMAPEMLGGSVSITVRTDVYLLGAILHEVLTGRPPHPGPSWPEVIVSIAESAPFDYGPEVGGELASIAWRAMDASPDARFESALAFRDALHRHLEHQSSMALALEGEVALEALERRLAAREPDDEGELRRLAIEADFAFRQALRAWSGNTLATARRESCVVHLCELDLAQRNAPGARALYAQLTAARPELEERLRALELELEEQARARAELANVARDRDFGLSARARAAVVLAVWLPTLSILLAMDAWGIALTTTILFGLVVAAATVILAGAIVLRRSLLTNEANRTHQRALAAVNIVLCAVIGSCWLFEQPIEISFGAFLTVMVVFASQIAVWVEASLAWYLLALPAALSMMWLFPTRPNLWLAALSAATPIAAFLRLRLRRRAR